VLAAEKRPKDATLRKLHAIRITKWNLAINAGK